MTKAMSLDLFTNAGIKMEYKYSDLTILSMGLGQDSVTILLKLVYDKEFKAKYSPGKLLVLFANTHNEHPETYKYRDDVVIPLCKKHNIEFISIENDMGYHAESWKSLTHQWQNVKPTIGSVAYPKTCTHNLKLLPQYRYVEEYIGINYGVIYHADKTKNRKKGFVEFAKEHGKIRWLVGIARGEESRVADAEAETAMWKKQAVEVQYPLINEGLDRQDCQNYIKSLRYPIPMPSNCMYCPYGSNHMEILWMEKSYPDKFMEWAQLEQDKLDAWSDAEKNLGVCGKLHKDGERKGEAFTLLDLLSEAKQKFPDVTLSELNEYKWSHGHCVASKY